MAGAGARLRSNEGAAWGPACWEKAVLVEPSDVFKSTAADAAKRVEKDRKRKASHAAKTQRKKARYNSVDNSLSSRKAYSRYNYHSSTFYDGCRHGGGPDAVDVPTDIPANQL